MTFRDSTLRFFIIAFSTVLCLGCSHKSDNTEGIAVVDDSLRSHSSKSKEMIENGLKDAKDSIEYYEYAVRLGKLYLNSPSPDSSLTWISRTEAFASRQKSPRGKRLLAFAYNAHAAYYHNYHIKTEETLSLYNKAYNLLMEGDGEIEAPDVCANLGDAYIYENKLSDAAIWYRRALFLADSLHLPLKETLSLYMGLGSIYQRLDNFDETIRLYKETDKHFNEMPTSMQAYFLNNYGAVYYYLKNYKESLRKYKRLESFLIKRGMENNFDMYLCRLNLADVNLNLGNIDEAERLLDIVEPYWKKTGDPTAVYYCTTIRLGIALGKGDMTMGEKIVSTPDSSAKYIEQNMRGIRNEYVRHYYERLGEWHKAYNLLQQEKQVQDSVDRNIMAMRSADIMAQYQQDTLKLHHNIAIEKKNAEVNFARMWLGIAIAVIALLLVIIIHIIHRSHQRKLKSQMQIIKLRLERARGRISPHFMFNVLNNQIVSAADSTEKAEANDSAKRLADVTKLIRANLDIAGQMTDTLGEELEFVEKYVNVEKTLLADDDFSYIVDISSDIDVDKVRIPSMFVQIMVENSFVHGLMGKTGQKQLTVKAFRQGNATVVDVIDNGPGFDVKGGDKRRTGLKIIWQTMAVINYINRRKITFSLHNIEGENGVTIGCRATLLIPDGIRFPEWNDNF